MVEPNKANRDYKWSRRVTRNSRSRGVHCGAKADYKGSAVGCRPRRTAGDGNRGPWVEEHIRRGRSRRDLKESERVSLININSINKDNNYIASCFDIVKK